MRITAADVKAAVVHLLLQGESKTVEEVVREDVGILGSLSCEEEKLMETELERIARLVDRDGR